MQQTKPIVTKVSNHHASVTLLGVVVDSRANEVHYLSAIGPKSSLQSIWASLASRSKGSVGISSKFVYDADGRFRGYAFDSQYRARGGQGMKAYWAPLPNTAWAHMVATSEDVRNNRIIVVTDPQAVYLVGQERKARVREKMPEFIRRFVAALNQHTEVPVLEEWGEALFENAVRENWLKALTAQGDALFAGRLEGGTAFVLPALRSHLGVGKEVQP